MKSVINRNTIQNIKFLNIFVIIMFGSQMGRTREKQNKKETKMQITKTNIIIII